MDRVQKAMEYHKRGFNCAQSVACAFADIAGIDESTIFRAAEGFGLGMGDMECTCGAVTGAVIVCGLKNSTANLEKPDSKKETTGLAKEITKAFRQKNGSVICKEIKGVGTGKVLRSCDGCIEDAVRLVEEIVVK